MVGNEQYVFISYSSKDQQMADSVRLLFIEKGIPCWMAPYDIPAGSKYAYVINDALENCSCLVLLLTNASQESQFVEREIERAITYKKPIIPMQLEDIQLNSGFKFYIGNSQIIAVPNIKADAPEFNMVISGVRQFLGQDNPSLPEMKQTALQSLSAPKNTDAPLEPALPDRISLFELLKISNIGELDIEGIWAESDITKAIVAPIGVDQTGKSVSIDLHQRADGPNGMVIGPPGSGKTEFLHTYLLSLALHYPPEKIQLHLINSHDSSIVDDFVSLPHAGICLNEYTDSKVTNFVEYFKNEILRRQELLKHYSVANIYRYHKLAKTDPTLPALPHIVVAVDELQQLKCYFPAEAKYLQELGTGEQARAYGIHLLYATSHAEGIIDDSLYRVLNFKICSSMQSHFSQKESPSHGRPGRLYLQTQSHDSIRVIQLAYSGLPAPVASTNLSDNQWFFENKTQRQSIIQAITRLCLD